MRDQLEALVEGWSTKGILYDDARREFERRFIEQALHEADGSIGGAADADRRAPQHPHPQDRRVQAQDVTGRPASSSPAP